MLVFSVYSTTYLSVNTFGRETPSKKKFSEMQDFDKLPFPSQILINTNKYITQRLIPLI